MKILAVDLGLARTGLAVCDAGELLASPVGVIAEKNEDKLIAEIVRCAAELKAEMLVVGYPRNMDGSAGERARTCAAAAEKLKQKGGLSVELWDERCTTLSAHQALSTAGVRGKKRKSVVDAVAACMILEDFLRFRRGQKNMAF